MKRRFFSIIVILTLVMGLVPSALAAPTTIGLHPGETVTYQQRVPVNIVFIGYKRDSIEREALLRQLPRTYEPVVRFPQFYGLPGRDMGLKFNFDYNVNFT